MSASWDEYASRKTLERINLKIKPGQLYAIIGPVGAGKVLMKFQLQTSNQLHLSLLVNV